MILRNSWLFRLLGSRGTFVRGAFTKGLGWEISGRNCKSTLYGPVMYKAYMWATKIEWRPRVVIDELIFKIVSDRSSFGPGKDGDWLPQLVSRDFDGVGYFNYLAYDEAFAAENIEQAKETITNLEKMKDDVLQYIKYIAGASPEHTAHGLRLVPLVEEIDNAISEWKAGVGSLAKSSC